MAERRGRGGVRMLLAAWIGGMAIVLAAGPADAQEKETLAVQAGKVYREAMSQMKVAKWQQAADLFTQVIRRFNGYENVPDAQLYLAYCQLRQGLDEDYLRQIDLCIRVYNGTEVGLLAVNYKASYYISKKDAANFLEVLKEVAGPTGARPVPTYLLDPSQFHYYYTNVQNLRSSFARDFRDDVLTLCKTPELAGEALKVFAGTFKQGPDKLPNRWFWVQVCLQYRAGQAEQAEKTFKDYADYWGDDIRGKDLWWEYAEYHRTEGKDPAKAGEAYKTIAARWEGTGVAGDAGHRVAEALAADDAKVDEFVAYAEKFIERYQMTDAGNRVHALLLKRVIELAPKDEKMADRAFKMLQKDLDKMPPPERLARLDQLTRLAGSLKRTEKMTSLMTELLGDALWSGNAYAKAVSLAGAFPELKPAVEAARRRRQIYEMPTAQQIASTAPDQDDKLVASIAAAKQLEQLKVRLKDDQIRFAEEIAEEMFTRYTDTAATIQAVQLMVDYYFKQVMVEPRDKWMKRMIETWPYHPTTEEALHKRCVSDKAQAEYDSLTQNVEMALSRFPSSQYRSYWYSYRINCYEAAKDAQGKYDLMARELNWIIINGNMYNLGQLIGAKPVPEGVDRNVAVAEQWLEWSRKFGNTHPGLSCISQAHAIYTNRYNKLFDRGVATSKMLREQKIDPAVAWQQQYDDIDLLLLQEKLVDATAEAAKRLALEARPQFRQFRRLDTAALGAAFGKAGRISEARSLHNKLVGVYKIPEDVDAVDLMLANAYSAAENPQPSPKAAELLLKVAGRMEPTDLGCSLTVQGAYHARGIKKYDDILNAFIRQIPRAQHLLPGLYNKLGQHYLGTQDRRVFSTQDTLERVYPASTARDDLDQRIQRARDAARKK